MRKYEHTKKIHKGKSFNVIWGFSLPCFEYVKRDTYHIREYGKRVLLTYGKRYIYLFQVEPLNVSF